MTTPDDPTWSEQEIDARANELPPYFPPLPGIDPHISQDPGLFAEEHAARFGVVSLARAAVASGTAAAMVAAAVALLGMGEHPPNHNAVTLEYNREVAKIGDGPWCDMGVTVEAIHSGNLDAVCGGPHRGFAYTPAHAADFKRRGLWHSGLSGAQPGDIVFFNWSRKKGIDDVEHVGIVEHRYSDGTVATVECNIGDACRREHRDSTYVVGYGRPPYNAQQQEDDMPDYVSLGLSKPQPVKNSQVARINFDTEYSDKAKQHADGPHPGILTGGKNGRMFSIEVDFSGSGGGDYRLIETDPAKDHAISKTYPMNKPTYVGLCDSNKHLYVEVHPAADGDVNVAVKALSWAR
jgi:hypothetical protein